MNDGTYIVRNVTKSKQEILKYIHMKYIHTLIFSFH